MDHQESQESARLPAEAPNRPETAPSQRVRGLGVVRTIEDEQNPRVVDQFEGPPMPGAESTAEEEAKEVFAPSEQRTPTQGSVIEQHLKEAQTEEEPDHPHQTTTEVAPHETTGKAKEESTEGKDLWENLDEKEVL